MLVHPTVERLRALGLTAMADAFIEMQNAPDAGELSREDWLGLLVDREATSRENKRLARRLRDARLRQVARKRHGAGRYPLPTRSDFQTAMKGDRLWPLRSHPSGCRAPGRDWRAR